MAQNSDLQLTIGYWIVSHKQTLRAWWAIGLMSVMVASLLWMLFFFTVFIGQDGKMNTIMLRAVVGAGSFRSSAFAPQALTVSASTAIPRDLTHADVVAEVTNSNDVWAAQTLTGHFVVDGTNLSSMQLFLNQAATRPVILLNTTVKNSSSVQVSFVVDDVNWARANAAGLPAPKFTVTASTVSPSIVTIAGQSRTSVTLDGEVMNASVYNFYRVDVPILFMNGDRIVGAEQVTISRWPTLTTKPVKATLTYPVTGVSSVRIEPQVSRFDVGNTYR